MKRVEGEYGTLHVRHFGVGIERRPFRENTNLEEEVIFAAAATLQRITSITEGYTDKLDFTPHYTL